MKRLLVMVIALLITIPIAMGIVVAMSYRTTSEDTVPQPEVLVMDSQVRPAAYRWYEPVFGGLMYRDFRKEETGAPQRVGVLNDATLKLVPPDGYQCNVEILGGGQVLWTGNAVEFAAYRFIDNGEYQLRIQCVRTRDKVKGYGSFQYLCSFTVAVQPRIEVSEEWITQGEVVAIRVFNLTRDAIPTASSDLGVVTFVQDAPGTATAYVAVGHERPPGVYNTTVSVGRFSWDVPVRVLDAKFDSQNVEVDSWDAWRLESDDVLASWDGNAAIRPLLDETVPQRYWDGMFVAPVNGEVECGYGILRYPNNSSQALQHNGIDYAGRVGQAVVAPAAGQVVFAGYIDSCGNTIVIEHGGGVKSLLLYMDELTVEMGDMVEAGQSIGTLGQSGNAVTPHLHYEVRIGRYTVDPQLLLDGTSDLYHFPLLEAVDEGGDEGEPEPG